MLVQTLTQTPNRSEALAAGYRTQTSRFLQARLPPEALVSEVLVSEVLVSEALVSEVLVSEALASFAGPSVAGNRRACTSIGPRPAHVDRRCREQ